MASKFWLTAIVLFSAVACGPARSLPSGSSGQTITWIRSTPTESEPSILESLRQTGARVTAIDAADAEKKELEGTSALIGVGAAGRVAVTVATRPSTKIARVVALNGTYEGISPFSSSSASELLLLTIAEQDASAVSARHLAQAIGPKRAAHYVGQKTDLAEMKKLAIDFLAHGHQPLSIDSPFGIQQRWGNLEPPVDNADVFWKSSPTLVSSHPTNGQFLVALTKIFSDSMHLLAPYQPLAQYQSIPLEAYLAGHSTGSKGEHLILTNVRGEQLYLTRKQIEEHKPEIVIGIEDEKNLYRLALGYRLEQERSWEKKTEKPPTMVRAVGPFLFFPKGPPPDLEDTTMASFCLTPASFRFVADDPVLNARRIPADSDLRAALLGADGCLKCHGIREMGARVSAHHVRAIDGKPHGGFALPLETYPSGVLDRFLFDQKTVAASFGVTPLTIPESTAKQLLTFVKSSK